MCGAVVCSMCDSSLLVMCFRSRVLQMRFRPTSREWLKLITAQVLCQALVAEYMVGRSDIMSWMWYTFQVRTHELAAVRVMVTPSVIRGLLHQNVEVRNQELVAVDDSTQTIMRGCGDVLCSSSYINGWLWDALQTRNRNFHLTSF